MVIPNFFITFVRHSFHTSHPLHIPSRERRHRPAPPCHQAPHSFMAHALPHALSARDCLTRCTSQGLCHTRHTHATHPRPHSTLALRATTPRKGLRHMRHAHCSSRITHTRLHPRPHSTLALRATPSQGLRHATLPSSMKATLLHAHSPSALPPLTRATPCHATTKHESHTPPRTLAPQVF